MNVQPSEWEWIHSGHVLCISILDFSPAFVAKRPSWYCLQGLRPRPTFGPSADEAKRRREFQIGRCSRQLVRSTG
jgi:hypothetical protein